MASDDPVDDELNRLRKDLLQFLTEDIARSGLAGKNVALSDAIRKDIADAVISTLKENVDARYAADRQSLNAALQEKSELITQQIAKLDNQAASMGIETSNLQKITTTLLDGIKDIPKGGDQKNDEPPKEPKTGSNPIRQQLNENDNRNGVTSSAGQGADSKHWVVIALLALAVVAANAFAVYYFSQSGIGPAQSPSAICTLADRIKAVRSDPLYAEELQKIIDAETQLASAPPTEISAETDTQVPAGGGGEAAPAASEGATEAPDGDATEDSEAKKAAPKDETLSAKLTALMTSTDEEIIAANITIECVEAEAEG